jgi:glycosyltransferase involved in cell wall biosynthesis
MQRPLPTITIGIPAYNEEDNIVFLIDALKTQKVDRGQIIEIIVISDGSTDRTVELVQSVSDERIKLIIWDKREGLNSAQNKIILEARGDILVILNADVLPANDVFVQEIIAPILNDNRVGLVGADMTVADPLGIFEAVIANSYKMKNNIYKALSSQNNIYLCHGQARAFPRAFYSQMNWPDEFPEDAYSYIMCLQKGFAFCFAPRANVVFRCPQNLSDHLRQSGRFVDGKERLMQTFTPSVIRKYYCIPQLLFFRELGKLLARHPFLTSAYLLIMIYVRMSGWRPSHASRYEISKSSKKILV